MLLALLRAELLELRYELCRHSRHNLLPPRWLLALQPQLPQHQHAQILRQFVQFARLLPPLWRQLPQKKQIEQQLQLPT